MSVGQSTSCAPSDAQGTQKTSGLCDKEPGSFTSSRCCGARSWRSAERIAGSAASGSTTPATRGASPVTWQGCSRTYDRRWIPPDVPVCTVVSCPRADCSSSYGTGIVIGVLLAPLTLTRLHSRLLVDLAQRRVSCVRSVFLQRRPDDFRYHQPRWGAVRGSAEKGNAMSAAKSGAPLYPAARGRVRSVKGTGWRTGDATKGRAEPS